jgi:hypothetical protein
VLATGGAQAAQFVLNGTLNALPPAVRSRRARVDGPPTGMALRRADTDDARGPAGDRLLVGPPGTTVGDRHRLVVCSAAVVLVSVAPTCQKSSRPSSRTRPASPPRQRPRARISRPTRRARYGAAHGVFGTIYDVGDALGPIVAGVLVAAVGYTRMFQVMAAVALTIAGAFAAASRMGITAGGAPRT